MAERTDILTITLTHYREANPKLIGWRWMGTGRRAIDFRHFSIIIECWWIR
jgi:hypothetical protein